MDQWTHQLPNIIAPNLKQWLIDPESTTKKFSHMNLTMSINLLHSELVLKPAVAQNENKMTLHREVSIHVDSCLFMYATSVFEGDHQSLKTIANLKNDSLGTILFQDPSLKRSSFEFLVGFIPGKHSSIMDIDHQHYIARKSLIHTLTLKCNLIEAFNTHHPLLAGGDNG